MRTSNTLSQQEINDFTDFCISRGIQMQGEVGVKNGEEISQIIINRLNDYITPDTLQAAVAFLGNKITYLSPVEAEFNRMKYRLTDEQSSLVLRFIPSYSLSTQGQDEMVNFSAIVEWFTGRSQPITWDNLNRLIGNVQNQSSSRLIWQRRLQDSEKEALRLKTEDKIRHEQYLKDHPAEKRTRSFPTDEKLEAHKEMMQRPAETIKAQQGDQGAYWHGRCQQAVASVQSNLDRAEVQGYITEASKSLSFNGSGTWETCYKKIMFRIEQRKLERSMAGRM